MKKVLAALLVLLLAGVGAWVVATRVESPEQVAARAEAPAPDPVVAPLQVGFLQGPVSMQTTARRERAVEVAPPPALSGVVTFAGLAPGQTLLPGSVLLRANGRPVFVLPGAFALYRDLQPGDIGDDVAAVQDGLQLAGYSVGRDRTGSYGPGTQSAVRQMYRAAGYVAPSASPPTGAEAPAPAQPDAKTESSPSATPAPSVATGTLGTQVLMTEIITVSDLPAVIESVAPVGTQLNGETKLATLGAGQTLLSATVPTGSATTLALNATGTFVDDAGAQSTAQVAALTPNAENSETVVSLSATGLVTPGRAYVVAIDNPAAETGESLLAPTAAIVSRGGRSYVYLRDGQGFREIEVQVVGSVGGVAAITAVDSSELKEGSEVRIG